MARSQTRRELLAASLASPFLFRQLPAVRADRSIPEPPRRCILLWLQGGLSPLDSFDPKPGASENLRGPFASIPTSVPSVSFCEHLPRLARLADRFQVVRSFRPGMATHGLAEAMLLSGREPRPGARPGCFGSTIAASLAPSSVRPPFVQIGRDLDHAFGGGLAPSGQPHLDPIVLDASESTLEPSSLRLLDRYGHTPLGARCLLARQLVEQGTPFVTVTSGGWDHHENLAEQLPPRLLSLDQALSALLLDLEALGLLTTTLVLVLSDFGRNPLVNRYGGRGHWPHTGLCIRAGGPSLPSGTLGSTCSIGAEVLGQPCGPSFVLHTILDHFALDLT